MNNKVVPVNLIYLTGAVDALFSEYEHALGPFLSDLSEYELLIYNGPEPGEHKVVIAFAIISDDKSHDEVYITIKDGQTKLDSLRMQVEVAAEQIIRIIKRFQDEH